MINVNGDYSPSPHHQRVRAYSTYPRGRWRWFDLDRLSEAIVRLPVPRHHVGPGAPEALSHRDTSKLGRETPIFKQSQNVIDHIRYRQLGGVQLDGIVCRFEWRHGALGIARVTSLNLFQKTR